MATTTNNKIKWKLVIRKISELKPYEKNPRRITEKGLKDLQNSLDKFGLAEPIVINTDNLIIGGHARYFLLKAMKKDSCECFMPNRKLLIKEVKELNVRLNKNVAGVFDMDILANDYNVSELINWGFENYELGYDMKDKINEQDEWEGMPEFQSGTEPYKIIIQFENDIDRQEFIDKYKLNIINNNKKTCSAWYPFQKKNFQTKKMKYE